MKKHLWIALISLLALVLCTGCSATATTAVSNLLLIGTLVCSAVFTYAAYFLIERIGRQIT